MAAQQRRLQAVLNHIAPSKTLDVSSNVCWAKGADYTREKLNTTTMSAERAKAEFDVRELTYLLDGGKDMTEVLDLQSDVFTHLKKTGILRTTAAGMFYWNAVPLLAIAYTIY
jgi:hypothetical protein